MYQINEMVVCIRRVGADVLVHKGILAKTRRILMDIQTYDVELFISDEEIYVNTEANSNLYWETYVDFNINKTF